MTALRISPPADADLHHFGGKLNDADKCSIGVGAGMAVDDDDTPPLLDHSVFPHIMDAIVRFSSPAALLRLRCTSRHYRSIVDGVFASHIVIRSARDHGPDAHEPSTPSSSFLDIAPHVAPQVRPPLDLTRTRVVDLVGPVGARTVAYRCTTGKTAHELYLEYLATLITRVDLVRLRAAADGRAPSACPIGARSLVSFTQLSEPECSSYPSPASVGPIPDIVERLVLNISYEPRSWWLPHATVLVPDLSNHAQLAEVVVLLSPRNSSPGCGRSYGECLGSPQWMGMMSSIVNLVCYTLPRVKFTLVGVDRLEPEWVGIEPDWMGTPPSMSSSLFDYHNDTVVHLVQDAIAAELRRRNAWDFDEADAALNAVRFLTRSQYEREITPRQFELEMWQ